MRDEADGTCALGPRRLHDALGALVLTYKIQHDGITRSQAILLACIWLPYMVVSKRVKATVYRIPMKRRAEVQRFRSMTAQSVLIS